MVNILYYLPTTFLVFMKVQTAISMFMVLKNAFGKALDLIDEVTLELWLSTYLDMLQGYKLFNNAAKLIKTSPVHSISSMSQQSTTFLSNW